MGNNSNRARESKAAERIEAVAGQGVAETTTGQNGSPAVVIGGGLMLEAMRRSLRWLPLTSKQQEPRKNDDGSVTKRIATASVEINPILLPGCRLAVNVYGHIRQTDGGKVRRTMTANFAGKGAGPGRVAPIFSHADGPGAIPAAVSEVCGMVIGEARAYLSTPESKLVRSEHQREEADADDLDF